MKLTPTHARPLLEILYGYDGDMIASRSSDNPTGVLAEGAFVAFSIT